MSALADREVNVLQAINLTLGTSAFLALADALPKMTNPVAAPSPGRIIYVSLVVFWAVKLLVENHKSFAGTRVRSHPRYAVFQLIMAVAMSLALILSAKNADVLALSVWWLMLSLAAGLIWLAGLALFVSVTERFDWKKYPWLWALSGIVTVVGALAIRCWDLEFDSAWAIAIIALMLVVGVLDAVVMKTFSLPEIEPTHG